MQCISIRDIDIFCLDRYKKNVGDQLALAADIGCQYLNSFGTDPGGGAPVRITPKLGYSYILFSFPSDYSALVWSSVGEGLTGASASAGASFVLASGW